MTVLTYVRETKDGKLKRFRKGTEEYWDPNDLTEYIDDAKLWNTFLATMKFKDRNKLMTKFEKFEKRNENSKSIKNL